MASSSSRRHFLRQSGMAAAGLSLGPLLNGCATGGGPKIEMVVLGTKLKL
jgi:hypothetical protein